MAKKGCVVVFCAHNDDQIVGAGGTLARYSAEGVPFYTVVFSYGESSHPHLKGSIARGMRIKEAKESDRLLGGSGISYLGIPEGKFLEMPKTARARVLRMLSKRKPVKVFTHSADDPHPDHRAVNKVMLDILDEFGFGGEVYSFDVWNPIKLRDREMPKLVVDITQTFSRKVKAFKAHKSQKAAILSLMWSIYLKAILHGFNNRCRYAEVFHKIR